MRKPDTDTQNTTDLEAAEGAAPETSNLDTYTVAPGRTVDGKQPGEPVELNEADAERLLGLGFILDVDGKQRFATEGPAVNVDGGVQIKPI